MTARGSSRGGQTTALPLWVKLWYFRTASQVVKDVRRGIILSQPKGAKSNRPCSGKRQAQSCHGSGIGLAAFEGKGSAVGFRNLAAEHQADSRALRLGGEERNKEIGGGGRAGPVVLHPHFQNMNVLLPSHFDVTTRYQSRFHGVLHQVDHKLLHLVAVGSNGKLGAGHQSHLQSVFQL